MNRKTSVLTREEIDQVSGGYDVVASSSGVYIDNGTSCSATPPASGDTGDGSSAANIVIQATLAFLGIRG